MKSALILFLSLTLALHAWAQEPVQIGIFKRPETHADEAVYLAGNFNNWNPQDEKFRLQPDGQGGLRLSFSLPAGDYLYKYTRGSWDKVECFIDGKDLGNRQLLVGTGGFTGRDLIEAWKDDFGKKPVFHSFSRNVTIIDTAFPITALGRTRRIWVYTPEDYFSSGRRYPVMYIQDGQNVFDMATSFSGEWGLDEALDTLGTRGWRGIVVAIDNGKEKRMNEYNPYSNERFGAGEGDAYLDFIVKKLKPWIDKQFRTIKDKQHTWIAGSSMGGLISFYALLRHPGVFGGAGVFSPAFWLTPQLDREIRKRGRRLNSRIYFYAGQNESAEMVPDILRLFNQLKKHSGAQMHMHFTPDGRHNEKSWRAELPLLLGWMGQ